MRQSNRDRDRTSSENRALIGARALVDRMRSLYRELEQMTDAPITLHRALLCVGEEPGIAASQLASRLGMKRPAISQVLKNLTTRGWIERRRSDADQRSVRIYVTADGRRILKLTSGRAVGILKRAVQALSGDDLHRLADGIEALMQKLPAERPSAQNLRPSAGDEDNRSSEAGPRPTSSRSG